MKKKKRIIMVTDGDEYAHKALEHIAKEIDASCVSQSQGNPTVLTGKQIVKYIMEAKKEPIFVMFDDSGVFGEGRGEKALMYVAKHPNIEVLGVIAVASKTKRGEWTKIDLSIDQNGELTPYGVDKEGIQELELGRLYGDTVYCLDQLNIPIVIGIGDIGKMYGKDHYKEGSPITRKAVEVILERSGFYESREKKET